MEFIFGAHKLSVGVKRNLLQPEHHCPQHIVTYTDLSGHLQERIFGGVTDTLSVHDGRIIRQDRIV